MSKWKCQGCGYVHDGESAPQCCPKCGAAAEKFEKLSDDAAAKIERARHTNMLHTKLISLCREMEWVCKDGIKDKLDPGCVDVFEKCLMNSYVMMKMSMAEIATHEKKDKWG